MRKFNYTNRMIMKQPELGKKILVLREEKNLTQKEMAESCHIDIRTVQRIEAGEVTPRPSTLRLIAELFECDINLFNGNEQENPPYLSSLLLTTAMIGVLYFINIIFYWTFFLSPFPSGEAHFYHSIINVATGVPFYYGLYQISKHQGNQLLQVAVIIAIVGIPYFVITDLAGHEAFHYLNLLGVVIIGINSIVLGVGLLRSKSRYQTLYKIAGLLQVVMGPLFIIPMPVVQWVGLYMGIPFTLLILTIEFMEYRFYRSENQLIVT